MADIVLKTEDPRYRSYTASAGQTDFDVPFHYKAAAGLRAVVISAAGAETSPSFTMDPAEDYGSEASPGVLSFDAALAGGETVIIYGETPAGRETSLTESLGNPSTSLNTEYSNLQKQLQEIRRDIARAARVPVGESQADGPRLAERASSFAAWDANGDPIAAAGLDVAVLETGWTPLLSSAPEASGLFPAAPVIREGATAAANVAAFLAAIADNRDFTLLANTYDLDDTVTIDTASMSILGPSPANVIAGDGKQAAWNVTADDTPHMLISGANATLSDIMLRTSGDGAAPFIQVAPSGGAGDGELVLRGVYFHGKDDDSTPLIEFNGRGFHSDGCWTVAGLAPWLDLGWDGVTEADNAANLGPIYGRRRYQVRNHILHSTSVLLVRNTGTDAQYVRGVYVDGVAGDVGGEVFQGVLVEGTLQNVHINWANSPIIDLYGGSQDSRLRNIVSIGHPTLSASRCSSAVRLGPGDHKEMDIDLFAARTNSHALRVDGDDPATTLLENITINIVGLEIGETGSASSLARFRDCTLRNVRIIGAFQKNAGNTATKVLEFDNCVIDGVYADVQYDPSGGLALTTEQDVIVLGSARDGVRRTAAGALDIVTDESRRLRVDEVGRIGMGTGTGALAYKFEVRDGGSIPAAISREGTGAAGLALRSQNSAAELTDHATLFGKFLDNTDGAEDGAFDLFAQVGGTSSRIMEIAQGFIRPGADNVMSGGEAGRRYTEIFAAAGSINTSDGTLKDVVSLDVEAVAALARAYDRIRWRAFRWKDAVERKGDKARLHFGAIAQEVEAAFAAEGLDATAYGLFCVDPLWDDVEIEPAKPPVYGEDKDGNKILLRPFEPAVTERRPRIDPATGEQAVRYGVRYDELQAFAQFVEQGRPRLEREPKTRTVTLKDGRSFRVSELDHQKLTLAGLLASRAQAVDVTLADGTTIEQVRSGELAEIARQILGAA